MTDSNALVKLKHAWPLIVLGLLLSYLIPFYFINIESIYSYWVFQDDARQWIWPLLHHSDPDLFKNDYIFNYAMAEMPIGYNFIYWLGSFVVDAHSFSKILSYALLFLTVLFASLSAAYLGGPVAGWASVALLLVGDFWLDWISGGLPTSFNPAFAAISTYSLVANRPWLLAIMTPIAASIYPPVCLVMGLALTLFFLLPRPTSGLAESWRIRRRALVLVISGSLALTILIFADLERAQYGPLIDATSPSDMAEYPERLGRQSTSMFNRQTELSAVLVMPLRYIATAAASEWHIISAHSALGRFFLTAIFVASIIIILRNATNPKFARLTLMPVAAVVMSLVAVALYPKLYYPSRYLMSVTLFFFISFPVALMLAGDWLRAPTEKVIVIGTLIFLILFGLRGPQSYAGDYSGGMQRIDSYLRTLPKNSLIAGWEVTDEILLLGRRSILTSYEMHTVDRTKYALQMRERTNALIEAYYAVVPEPLRRLHRDFGVTHLLAERRHFDLDYRPPKYFSPFDQRLRAAKNKTKNQKKIVELLLDSPYATRINAYLSIIDLTQWVDDADKNKLR